MPFSKFTQWLVVGGILAPGAVLAQGQAAVSGTVGSAGQPAPALVTVTLHRAADSVVVKTEFTDAKGAFELQAPVGGRYLVSAAQVGFRRYWSSAFALPGTGVVLPAISLEPSQATALKEVTVAGRRPLYERLADRTVVNVADSPLAAGASTFDILGRSPNVAVGSNNELALRGRQGVLVVLDGKRVPLTGNDLADYLRALPAEQVQRIELITNPPASYDAQGGAGVIAITLKKDQRLGTNGSLNASYGRGRYGKFVGGGTLNYRRKNLNLYGTYAFNDRQYYTQFDFDRYFGATATLPATRSNQSNYQYLKQLTHSAKVGFDLNLSKRTLLGVSVTGLASRTTNETTGDAFFYGDNGTLTNRIYSRAEQDVKRPNGSVNLNLRHAFADSATARTISADADYARYGNSRQLKLVTLQDVQAQSPTELTGDQSSKLGIGTAKVDYSQPLPHRTRLEAGAKVTQVASDNTVAFVNRTGVNPTDYVYTPRTDISQPFAYRENVNAAYVSLRGKLAQTSVQAGLRGEQTNIRADLGGATVREQHYFQLFPSLLVQRTLNKNHALALSAARRIDRPSYLQVSPLRVYLDATSYSTGNYNLQPQTSYNFEVSHTYKGKFTTALAYARTNQPFVVAQLPSPDGGRVVVNQYVNLSTQNFYTLNLIAPLEITKSWTLYANVLAYYNQYQGTLNSTMLDRGRLACNLTANNSFVLPRGWVAELNGFYESREVGGFQLLQHRGQVGAAVQKIFWNKQATFRLNATDVFYTTPLRVTSMYDNFSETFYRRQDTRVFTAAFSYRFGNTKVAAARKRAAGAEDELRRAADTQ
ncbi:TonB-dependent receptor domain-containing protein [Hymenobacter bucti]|uniref:TonB-dependent receptor domain-containing protein n=1 Tax=Hymenobacter bucti TaxID=1844114 RepID=A0ABW4QNY7_9BACT